jgi:hypothetical protein
MKKFPTFYIIQRFNKSPPLEPNLSHMNPVHILSFLLNKSRLKELIKQGHSAYLLEQDSTKCLMK